MEINDYVRTKDGKIGKYIQPELGKPNISNGISFNEGANYGKHSKDIIDLIEEKDTLLIYDKEYDDTYKSDVVEDNDKNLCVIDYEYNKIIDLKLELYLGNIEIRGILTREQFEQHCYKVEKER